MIKKVLKYSLLAYLAIPVLGILFLGIRNGFHPDLTGFLDGLFVVLLVEAGFFFVGLILGLIITAIARRPHLEWRFYLAGQTVAFLTLCTYITTGLMEDSNKKPQQVNNDAIIRSLTDNTTGPYVHLAFDSLKKKFPNAEDLELTTITTFIRDTVIDLHHDSSFRVYLEYTFHNLPNRKFYSKYLVDRRGARLVSFNKYTDVSPEYRRVMGEQNALKEEMKRAEQAVK